MSFRSDRQRKRVMGYELGHKSYPNNGMSHTERSSHIFTRHEGKIIQGQGDTKDFLILDNVVYDPFSTHVDSDTATQERDILINRGDEAIVRQNNNGKYQVWIRSR